MENFDDLYWLLIVLMIYGAGWLMGYVSFVKNEEIHFRKVAKLHDYIGYYEKKFAEIEQILKRNNNE